MVTKDILSIRTSTFSSHLGLFMSEPMCIFVPAHNSRGQIFDLLKWNDKGERGWERSIYLGWDVDMLNFAFFI